MTDAKPDAETLYRVLLWVVSVYMVGDDDWEPDVSAARMVDRLIRDDAERTAHDQPPTER